jgi:hypothetical protein
MPYSKCCLYFNVFCAPLLFFCFHFVYCLVLQCFLCLPATDTSVLSRHWNESLSSRLWHTFIPTQLQGPPHQMNFTFLIANGRRSVTMTTQLQWGKSLLPSQSLPYHIQFAMTARQLLRHECCAEKYKQFSAGNCRSGVAGPRLTSCVTTKQKHSWETGSRSAGPEIPAFMEP